MLVNSIVNKKGQNQIHNDHNGNDYEGAFLISAAVTLYSQITFQEFAFDNLSASHEIDGN